MCPSLAGTVPAIRLSTSDIPVTPLISGNWLSSASCGSIGNFKTTIATGVTTTSANLPATFSCTNPTMTVQHDIRKPLPVTAVSSSMFTFGLHNDAFQRLIPRLFPVSVVSSASSTTDIQSVHVLSRAPAAIGIDGKLNVAVDRVYGVPVSNEHSMHTERVNIEASGAFGMAQCVTTIADSANKSRAILAGKPNKLTVKDRRYGPPKAAEDVGLQRGSNKSHLTVAQLLEQAKNARLTMTSSEEDFSAELTTDFLASMTHSSNSSSINNSCSPSHVSVAVTEAESKTSIDKMKKTANSFPVISPPSGLPPGVPQSPMLPTAKPPSPVLAPVLPASSIPLSVMPVSVPLLPGVSASLPPPPPSLAHIVPVTAFAMPHQMAITSPRYPNNLTESMKRAMRGVGFYPSPPASPTTAAGGLLTGSNAADCCKDGAVADRDAKTVATALTGSEIDQTDKQYVISDILNELSKSESINKFNIIKSVDGRSEVVPSCTDYTETALLETSVESLESPNTVETVKLSSNICSLPDFIVSTTGINGCMGRSSENDSSPDGNSQIFGDVAFVTTTDNEQKLGLEKSVEPSAFTTADIAVSSKSIIQTASVGDTTEISSKGSVENTLIIASSSPSSQLLSQNLDSETTVPETTSILSEHITTEVVFSELLSKDSSTFDSLSATEGRVLVNGYVVEQSDPWVPEATLDDGSLLNDSSSTASMGDEPTSSMLAVRSSSRRGTRVNSGTSCSSQLPKTAVSTATRRMTTRSSNRTTSSAVTVDPATSDAVSNAAPKLATRRTPSKVPEVLSCSSVDTSNAASSSQETDSISASSRRSPRIITCAIDSRKPEAPSTAFKPEPSPAAMASDGSTPGVSLRSRAKVMQLMPNAKNVINSMGRRVVAKDASARQPDVLSENFTHDAVSRISDNSLKCDLNGSDEIL